MTFTQICSAAAEPALRACIDGMHREGRGYEIPGCQMPAGCVPERVTVGFLRRGEGCLLYWRPSVDYRGNSRVLSALFARSVWTFESYEAMAGRLLSLRREAGAPSVQPYHAPPLTASPPNRSERTSTPSNGAGQPSAPLRAAAPETPPQGPWPRLYLRLREALGQAVLGQDRALEAAAFRLYSHAGKRAPARPLSLIFHGPTGVGKSELGKAVAPALERCLGRRYQSVWTELNTYTQPHSVHRLTGAPPGYVGYEDPPVFEAVRQNPCTVFMFDELEKAHPEVLKVFMSILDEGRCSARRADEQGSRELDFRRCIFLFTTNADLTAAGSRSLGFSAAPPPERPPEEAAAASPAELAKRLFQENEWGRQAMVRQGVLAEIAGRFGGIIAFRPLDAQARQAVTVKQIQALGREYGLEVAQVDPDTAQALTPGPEALSARSSVCVLESLLAPLFSEACGLRRCRLSGPPEALRLLYCGGISSSSTELFATS